MTSLCVALHCSALNNSLSSEILERNQESIVNATMDRNLNVVDNRYGTSRTKDRMRHMHEENKADVVESIVEHADDELKSVVIIGDSILNDINPSGISKHGNVKVKNFPGSTSEAMKDYINPTI